MTITGWILLLGQKGHTIGSLKVEALDNGLDPISAAVGLFRRIDVTGAQADTHQPVTLDQWNACSERSPSILAADARSALAHARAMYNDRNFDEAIAAADEARASGDPHSLSSAASSIRVGSKFVAAPEMR
jgi:hypothetical protein